MGPESVHVLSAAHPRQGASGHTRQPGSALEPIRQGVRLSTPRSSSHDEVENIVVEGCHITAEIAELLSERPGRF